jgi:hypothetical protein
MDSMTTALKNRLFVTLDQSTNRPHATLDTVQSAITNDSYTNDNGHLIVDAFLTRPGVFEYLAGEIKSQWPDNAEVQKYADTDILRAYRSPESVTSDSYLESAKYAPVTDNHPPVMLHPDTINGYPVGTSTELVTVDQGRPRARLVLWDKKAIEAREKGKTEISIGAYNRFVWGPGTTEDGEPYDFEIKDSIVNHIAIVDRGRAGRGVKIIDAAPKTATNAEGKTMKVSIGGVTFDLDDQAVTLLNKERSETSSTMDRLEGQIEALKTKKPTLDDDAFRAAVDAEIARRENAAAVDNARKAVKDAGFTVDGKSDDYILGIFEGLKVEEKTATVDAGVQFSASPTTVDNRGKIAALKARQYR